MAFIRDLTKKCDRCNFKRATKELVNRWNESIGDYCASCAKIKLKETLAKETGNQA